MSEDKFYEIKRVRIKVVQHDLRNPTSYRSTHFVIKFSNSSFRVNAQTSSNLFETQSLEFETSESRIPETITEQPK